MATWHQLRRPTRLNHDTDWTVVIDPPHGLRCLMSFRTIEEAQAYIVRCKALRPHEPCYVLPPSPRK